MRTLANRFFVYFLLKLTGSALALTLLWLPCHEAEAQSVIRGEMIFAEKCASCHAASAQLGPSLEGVTKRRDHQWLTRYISEPEKMLAERDPILMELYAKYQIPMPNPNLSKTDVASVIAYLAQANFGTGGGMQSEVQPLAALAIQGNPTVGEDLFEGKRRLANGAAPCIACHNVASVALLGGGKLGPDLTDVQQRYGEQGLASVLAATPFPTMQPIYQAHPLTPEEQAHLRSFFTQKQGVYAQPNLGGVVLAIAFGCAFGILLMPLILRHRLRGVRKTLVEQASVHRKGNPKS